MSLFRKGERGVPGLNTASLPDLIFTVLFFFMIVTTMRTADDAVDYEKPQAAQLEKTKKTPYTYYVYIGRPAGGSADSTIIRLDGQTMTPEDITAYMLSERGTMTPDEQRLITVNIVADRNAPMGIVADVKQALRTNMPIRIRYSATDETSR